MLVKAREKFWTPQSIAPYYKVVGGGGGTPTFTKTDRPVKQNISGTTGTITAATGTGTVIVCGIFENCTVPTSITLNGSAMSLGVKSIPSTNNIIVGIYYLAGQTVNAASSIVVNGAFLGGVQIMTAVLTNVNATPGTGSVFNEGTGSPITTGSITVPATGFGICTWYDATDASGVTDVGGNLNFPPDYQSNNTTNIGGMAHSTTSGAQTASLGTGVGNTYAVAFLPWGP